MSRAFTKESDEQMSADELPERPARAVEVEIVVISYLPVADGT